MIKPPGRPFESVRELRDAVEEIIDRRGAGAITEIEWRELIDAIFRELRRMKIR